MRLFAAMLLGVMPGEATRSFYDLLYMSMGYLTSNGRGDLVLIGARVRTLAILEQPRQGRQAG